MSEDNGKVSGIVVNSEVLYEVKVIPCYSGLRIYDYKITPRSLPNLYIHPNMSYISPMRYNVQIPYVRYDIHILFI